MRGRRPRCRWLTATGGGVMAAVAVTCALAWTSIFDAMLSSQMALTPNSLSYHKWVAPEVPLFMEVFMFNWTNADRFPEEKPKFQELGPYRFREIRKHVNVSFFPHNDSVAYRTQRTWFYDETSNGSLTDTITTLNVIAASAVYRSRYWTYLQQKGLSMGLAMFGQHLSITKTAGEMLFEGYEDPLLDLAKSLPASTTGGAPPVDRFGWFYGRNNSIDTDGYVEITSGVSDGLPGRILKWNHEKSLPFYDGKCARVEGSAGEYMPRGLDARNDLTMFVPDLCRTVNMQYAASGQIEGIPYHKFHMTERTFDNSSVSSDNTCFCHGACRWSGVMNVSACRFGSPSFLSLPHFLYADQELRDNVEGMNPNPDKHSFYMAVEPRLGVPVDVAGRFQYNVYIEKSKYVTLYENMPTMLFPMFWVQQAVTVSEEVFSEIRMVRLLWDWGGVVCACFGIGFTTIAIAATCCCTGSKKPKYSRPDILSEKPRDEAEMKLNPK